MKTVTLNILAKDIKTTKYHDSHDCAITRALRRAGIEAHEGGSHIYSDSNDSTLATTPKEGEKRVYAMYAYCDKTKGVWRYGDNDEIIEPIEPANFSFDVTLDID